MEVAESTRLAAIADKLHCITEEDLALLARSELDTVRSWRSRGEGPDFFKAGNRALYPLSAVSAWLDTRKKERPWTSVRVPL